MCIRDRLSEWALDPSTDQETFPSENEAVQGLGLDAESVIQLLEKRGDVLEVAEAFV